MHPDNSFTQPRNSGTGALRPRGPPAGMACSFASCPQSCAPCFCLIGGDNYPVRVGQCGGERRGSGYARGSSCVRDRKATVFGVIGCKSEAGFRLVPLPFRSYRVHHRKSRRASVPTRAQCREAQRLSLKSCQRRFLLTGSERRDAAIAAVPSWMAVC